MEVGVEGGFAASRRPQRIPGISWNPLPQAGGTFAVPEMQEALRGLAGQPPAGVGRQDPSDLGVGHSGTEAGEFPVGEKSLYRGTKNWVHWRETGTKIFVPLYKYSPHTAFEKNPGGKITGKIWVQRLSQVVKAVFDISLRKRLLPKVKKILLSLSARVMRSSPCQPTEVSPPLNRTPYGFEEFFPIYFPHAFFFCPGKGSASGY